MQFTDKLERQQRCYLYYGFTFFFKARISPPFYSSVRELLYNIKLTFIKYE